MAKVLFKKGPSQSFDTDKDLNSIIFKKSTNPQAPGFSEIYLGDNRCGVGHNFSIGSDGLVPAPTMADIGKVLTPNGWIDVSKISGSDNVKQVGIESSTTLYPILLKGTTGVSDYTGQVNFTSGVNQNIPLLSASPDGHLNCKSLDVVEGDASFLLGDINLMDIPLMSSGHSLNLVSSVNGSTESSPSILLARSESLGTTTDQYTNWRIQNAANGVLTFTPEKTGGSETPFVSVLSNVTAISFTVSGVSSSDTYIKADGSGYGGVFTGAGQAVGTAGLVPAPAIGDAGKYLKGDGTWGEIQGGVQSDWEEDDSTDLSYVQNRPAVRAGTGTNAVIEGDIENVKAWGLYSHAEGGDSIWTSIELSGDADSSSYTVDQSSANIVVGMVLHYNGSYASVIDTYTFDDEVTVVLDNTLDENNALSNAEVDIVGGVSMGSYSHSEGFHTVSGATGSHSEGYGTITVNDGEHAEGKYNLPTRSNMVGGSITQHNTVHTIGIGLDEGTRMNAVEVKYNGDMYLYGVGGYEGNNYGDAQTLQGVIADIQDFGSNMVSTTHTELENLITNSQLIPGQQYRITDYVCTTTQANTQSAGHQFDIIVTADSENTLNENARAIQHTTSNQDYFYNCDLDSWEIKYCLENDTNRFAWADTTNGKGVIYYMKDEWNNIAPFDFKNILFTRDTTWFNNHQSWATSVLGSVPSTNMNFYFLSWITQNNEVQDLSIVGQTLTNNGGKYVGVFNNEIKGTSAYDMSITENATTTAFALPCTIIVNNYSYRSGNFYGCYGNSFGNSCYNNSFGNKCYCVTFGNKCYGNTFGNDCYGNSLDHSCYNNSFGNTCSNNTFRNNCFNNSFGGGCFQNSFGVGCYGNTFGENFQLNSFGDYCYENTFGSNIQCLTAFERVHWCNVTGGTNTTIKNTQILNGTHGTSGSSKLTITFTANKKYTQVAGLVNGTTLRIWIAEDTVTGPTTATDSHIALFDGTTGKIIKDSGVTVGDLQVDVPEYTIEKLNQVETGYASSYVLKKDDVQVGATINIPKDMVVSSGEVKTVTTANVPYQGAQVGDKYIDLTIANSSSQHIYIPVKDLVDVYQAGNGISIDASNYISVKIDSANANGLDTTTAGLKLDTVTTTTNGAMSSTDKTNLDTIYGNYLKAGDTIGTVSVTDFNPVSDTVHVTSQSLGASQQAQARSNISAQESLVSGTNIKTINGQSILGSGNLEIGGGGGGGSITVDTEMSSSSTNPVQNRVITSALSGKVSDVQVGGTSVVQNGIASIPSNTDTKVTQTVTSSSISSNWRGILIGSSNVASESGALTTTTDTSLIFSELRYQPSTGTLKATKFKGSLEGTASGNLTSASTLDPTKLSGYSSTGTKYLRQDGTWQTVSSGGGTATDVQINGTSITSNNVANIVTNTAYDASSNKIATMSDVPAAANNAKISIQKGGAAVDSFTVNASSNKTINIPNELPSYSSSNNGQILSVNSSGQLVWITPVSIYTGSGSPSDQQGANGDIYLQM